jgi:hypothetical protein
MKPPTEPKIERLSMDRLLESLLEHVHLDRGLGYTVKLLLLRPGQAIQEYLFVDRRRMMRPFTLLLLSVGVATFLSLKFLLEEGAVNQAGAELAAFPERVQGALLLALQGIQQYFNLVYMSSLVPMTLASLLVFRAHRLNFAEHLVLNTFLFSMQTIAYILFIPLLVLGESWVTWIVAIPVIYTVWFYRDVFGLGWRAAALRTVFVFALGQVCWLILGAIVFGVFMIFSG